MLPKNVYDHVRYGNGARPEASATLIDGSHIHVEPRREPPHYRITIRARLYPPDFCANPKARARDIALSECPEDADWQTYWTHEA